MDIFPPKEQWKDSKYCSGCTKAFTMLNRKHHCRLCAFPFCYACCNNRYVIDHDQSLKSRVSDIILSYSKILSNQQGWRFCGACFEQLPSILEKSENNKSISDNYASLDNVCCLSTCKTVPGSCPHGNSLGSSSYGGTIGRANVGYAARTSITNASAPFSQGVSNMNHVNLSSNATNNAGRDSQMFTDLKRSSSRPIIRNQSIYGGVELNYTDPSYAGSYSGYSGKSVGTSASSKSPSSAFGTYGNSASSASKSPEETVCLHMKTRVVKEIELLSRSVIQFRVLRYTNNLCKIIHKNADKFIGHNALALHVFFSFNWSQSIAVVDPCKYLKLVCKPKHTYHECNTVVDLGFGEAFVSDSFLESFSASSPMSTESTRETPQQTQATSVHLLRSESATSSERISESPHDFFKCMNTTCFPHLQLNDLFILLLSGKWFELPQTDAGKFLKTLIKQIQSLIQEKKEYSISHLHYSFATLMKKVNVQDHMSMIYSLLSDTDIWTIYGHITFDSQGYVAYNTSKCIATFCNLIEQRSSKLYTRIKNSFGFFKSLVESVDSVDSRTDQKWFQSQISCKLSYLFREFQHTDVYLPYKSSLRIIGFVESSVCAFASKKRPFVVTFVCIDSTRNEQLEIPILFKRDLLVNDIVALQLIDFCESYLHTIIKHRTRKYSVVQLTNDWGLIEYVHNAVTVRSIYTKKMTIYDYLVDLAIDSKHSVTQIFDTYLASLVYYTIFNYFVGITDRHFDNIMIDTDGNIFHIDFGFIMGVKSMTCGVSGISLDRTVTVTADILDPIKRKRKVDLFSKYTATLTICTKVIADLWNVFQLIFHSIEKNENDYQICKIHMESKFSDKPEELILQEVLGTRFDEFKSIAKEYINTHNPMIY